MDSTPAFVMHIRPFKNSSAIVDFFTISQGLMSAVVKGMKRPKSRQYSMIQPFIPLQINYVGRSELKTLTQVDSECPIPLLQGKNILLGIYLNELIVKLFEYHDAHPLLFEAYHMALQLLGKASDALEQQAVLRQFELQLLGELGYALVLEQDGKTHQPIEKDLLYSYSPKIGLYEVSSQLDAEICISGASLCAFATNARMTEHELREIKHLMRHVLAHYLGNQTIESRQLFRTKTYE